MNSELNDLGGVTVTREDLHPWHNFTTRRSEAIECFIDSPPKTGRPLTIHLFAQHESEPFGSVYVRHREDQIILSNISVGARTRNGIGTEIVKKLLEVFPRHQVRGENPNINALQWHTHLEKAFGNRMIPFTKAEIDNAHKQEHFNRLYADPEI